MSKLLSIKTLVIANLDVEPEVKEAIIDVFNAIDGDLDEAGYEPSDETETALDKLDEVLIKGVEEIPSDDATTADDDEDEDILKGFGENDNEPAQE